MTTIEEGRERLLRYESSLDCVHCGLCLSNCPTYLETGDETAGPRGRIYLMRALAEGRVEADAAFAAPMELCLACRGCESVCPSDVAFGTMMEITRHELLTVQRGSWAGRTLKRFMLRKLVPSRRGLAVAATLLRFYERSGLAKIVRRLGLLHVLPRRLRTMEEQTPQVPPARARRPLPSMSKASGASAPRGRVAYLEGCVMPQLLGDANRAVVAALTHAGFDVEVPPQQTCCGALHAHAGDVDFARELARRNVAAFEGFDRIVLGSAGCGAALLDYPRWLEGQPHENAARELAGKVVDILALFDELELAPRGRDEFIGRKVTYDAPCHLCHAQGCVEPPRRVVANIPGVEVVPLEDSEICCGAAGIYSITQPEMSAAILDRKLDALERSGADLLLTGNPGCILQWRRGIAERGLEVEVRHPAELL